MTESEKNWQFWIDRGGTFTDIIAKTPENTLITRKLLSENPEHYADAALQGIADCLQDSDQKTISAVKMGTTVGTNALLEGKGEKTALLITKGYKDCLRIAYQNRPDIFALKIELPSLLYQSVIEINERIDAQGHVLSALDQQQIKQQLLTLHATGIRSIAIVLMHAWRYPEHECQIAKMAKKLGFSQISVSHQVSPFMKIVSRGDTTVVDAYLSPILKHYVNQVKHGLSFNHPLPRLLFMQSNGGLTEAENFQGKDCILSGPAGGIIGAVSTSQQAGFDKIIAFDMGGTSTDVAHYAGELERSVETQVAGVRLRVPMLNIHTVAAGGGSLLSFDGIRYRVGPESAGANPGPAGYRRGGPLTVTDANIMLGKLPLFPAVFGKQGNLSLDKDKVTELFNQLSEHIKNSIDDQRNAYQVAEGFINIAVENMANAIKKISVQKGYNVSEYTLCCYGAAGGQHACKVADRLGMKQILLHPYSGLLSAYGMGLADLRLLKNKTLEQKWQEISETELLQHWSELEQQGVTEMQSQVSGQERISSLYTASIRYHGTDTALSVAYSNKTAMRKQFELDYKKQFGFVFDDKPLIVESLSVETVASLKVDIPLSNQSSHSGTDPIITTQMFSDDKLHQTPVFKRETLTTGTTLKGPAIIIEPTSTVVIEPGWQGNIKTNHDLVLSRITELKLLTAIGTTADPVMLEIFNKLFMSIAEQMGFVLQKTAYSVNIKERLDFSCALFDAQAQLVANAPHIPVHLGSMGESVLSLAHSETIDIKPGEVYLINSPYHGGTHLPDITVVSPVFDHNNKTLLFFVASRGHHADIGGISPGSMPADSQFIDQEGKLSSGIKIVMDGQFQQQSILDWLLTEPYPARNPEQNVADIQAQVAANNKGIIEIRNIIQQYSLETVMLYMQHVQNNAAESIRQILPDLSDGHFVNVMDNGAKVEVDIKINLLEKTATIDFTGTSPQLSSNFNAPAAVCKAAVLYVFRTLVADDIPLNAGCLEPLNIIIPRHSMLNPQYPTAVVAGNVETSQTIVDALYGALGKLAGSQGTMNNLTFGNQQYQYYETICGGTGAGNGFNGCDAVQSHMTNSRITDPEILEWRFPVILEQFSIRKNSGGDGQWKGGNGVIRKIKFLQPMSATLLSNHRVTQPFGIQQGGAGLAGVNTVIRINGKQTTLAGCVQVELDTLDVIKIETPGGGGYAKKN